MENHGREIDGMSSLRLKDGSIVDLNAPELPVVRREREGVRLVAKRRSDNTIDLTLERKHRDAMGADVWLYVDHWHVSPVDKSYFPHGKFDHVTVLLALLLGEDYKAPLSEQITTRF